MRRYILVASVLIGIPKAVSAHEVGGALMGSGVRKNIFFLSVIGFVALLLTSGVSYIGVRGVRIVLNTCIIIAALIAAGYVVYHGWVE